MSVLAQEEGNLAAGHNIVVLPDLGMADEHRARLRREILGSLADPPALSVRNPYVADGHCPLQILHPFVEEELDLICQDAHTAGAIIGHHVSPIDGDPRLPADFQGVGGDRDG
jgi:hypothetical protein